MRVSEDFFIEARKANPPQIALVRPARGDFHASPIEEVTIAAKATDEYGLHERDAALFGERRSREKRWMCCSKKGAKQADGATTLSLEDFKLVPGDLVSVYATAKDAQRGSPHRHDVHPGRSVRARIFAIAAVGRRRRRGWWRRGNQSAQISQREKEIISATFKQQGDKNSTQQQAAEISKLLAQSQATLHDQAMTLPGACRRAS